VPGDRTNAVLALQACVRTFGLAARDGLLAATIGARRTAINRNVSMPRGLSPQTELTSFDLGQVRKGEP
jgi:hypothetical protein